MLTFPAPAIVDGDLLSEQLAAAGFPEAVVTLVEGELRLSIEDVHRAEVEPVVEAHNPPPPVDHEEQFASAVAAIDTSKVTDPAAKAALDAIKAVLSGGKGPGAEPRRSAR
jgi:hypothetical protein